MTLARLSTAVPLAAGTVVAAAIVLVRPPLGFLLQHGAAAWAVAIVGLAVWPVALAVTHRWPVAWSTAVAVWAWTVVGVAARLHRWMTILTWALLAALVLLCAVAVWSRLRLALAPRASPGRSLSAG